MYIEKEKEILKALKDKDYFVFGHQQDKEKVLNRLAIQMLAFPQYANIVIKEQIMLPIWKQHLEPEDLKYNIEQIDSKRRTCHDLAIEATVWLNGLCNDLNIEKFANIDTNNRHAVAELVGNIVGEMYNLGIGKSFDNITYNKDKEYDLDIPKKTFQQYVDDLEDR